MSSVAFNHAVLSREESMNTHHGTGCFAAYASTTALALAMLGAAHADSGPGVINPNSNSYGQSFREWTAEWWQSMLSIPTPANPLTDTTGDNCMVGQRGPVWFLAGTFGGGPVTRNCSIPEGKAIFFPVLNLVDVNTTTQTVDELRAETAPCLTAASTLLAEVDGEAVSNLFGRHRVQSEVFEITLPSDSLFSFALPAGTYSPAIDDGFYVMLKPLAIGDHTLHIMGASDGCPLIGGPFEVDVTYNLTVVPVTR
jgi:hypothetical protein